MRNLSAGIADILQSLTGENEAGRKAARIYEVRERYAHVIKEIYRDTSHILLEHTNNVYILRKQEQTVLIVYMDESIYAAELNAQRELIRLRLLQVFNEQIDSFEIYTSRGNFKKNYPFKDSGFQRVSNASSDSAQEKKRLTAENRQFIDKTTSSITQDVLKEAIKKAMEADLKRIE